MVIWLYLPHLTHDSWTEEADGGETKPSLRSDWLTLQQRWFLSFCSELCRPAEKECGRARGKKSKKGTRRIIRAWRIALNCSTHSCMHTYAWAPAPAHTSCRRKHAFIHGPDLRILGLSAHVCRLIRASSETESKGSLRARCLWWKFGRQA